MDLLAQRMHNLPELMTVAMAKKSRAMQAAGQDVINLTLGEPDFKTPEPVKEAAKEAIQNNYTFYPPVAGYPDLKEAIAEKFRRENSLQVSSENILVSTGAKQSIANVLMSLLNPGDEVIIPAPYWTSYPTMVTCMGGRPVYVQTDATTSFKLQPEQLEAVITPKTKLLILCTPSNPTGAVYRKADLAKLTAVIARHPHMMVISDEIYEHINYIDEHGSLGAIDDIREQVITINGLSKCYAMTGWRIGYMAAPKWLAKACEKVQSQFTSGACSISQRAALAALALPKSYVQEMSMAFERRCTTVVEGLSRLDHIKALPVEGTFYVFPDIQAAIGKSYKGKPIQSAMDLSHLWLEKALVATVPGEAFGAPSCIRLSCAIAEPRLKEACERISQLMASVTSS